jgi:hypothetical protein
MHRDRWEELLMIIVGFGLLTFLFPMLLARDILMLLLLAFTLIILLILRGISWHEERITPYDGVLLLGIFFSVLYLFSMMPLGRVPLTWLTVMVFAVYYFIMAFLLIRHRGWLFGRPHRAMMAHTNNSRTSNYSHASRPIIAHNTPHAVGASHEVSASTPIESKPRRHILHRIFSRGHAHDHAHDPAFRKGIQPLHEMTKEEILRHAETQHHIDRHLAAHHPVVEYHDEGPSDIMVALPGSTVAHRESCKRLRSTKPGMKLFIDRKSSMFKKMSPCPVCKPF